MAAATVPPHEAEEAERLKNEANKLFQNCKFEQAIALYDKAIEKNPYVPAYYCNRAFAHLKTESYGYALADANKSIELDPNFIKAYYRRASANMALLRFKDALRDLKAVVQRAPGDPDARKKLEEVEKIVKRQAFEKAISTDEDARKPVSETIDVDAIIVEESYQGPRLDGEITEQFVLALLDWMKDQKTLHRKYLFKLLKQAIAILKPLPTLIDIPLEDGQHITVCGDTHGQFYDLLNIFKINGMPSPTNPYLFNGDFVDRGSFSVEVITTMMAFKVLYPNHYHVTRGNHETNDMNKIYGFEGEVKHKYNETMFKLFEEAFNSIPLAACIGGKALVVHGGLFSRDDVTLDELRAINRYKQPGNEGLMVEMLWSDPQPSPGRSPSKRGVGIHFGPDVTKAFLERNGLELLIRSHEAKDNGYEVEHDGKCITVFSAPNYCDQLGNKGAFVKLTTAYKPEFTIFEAVPHPNIKPMAYASSFAMAGL